ncbi:7693_t:CDS:2 [Diversispora eburnea]|uniref:7693_t:CDS:1 n=1 Tax=Diversispora eburnea TaxID=1213867 RepID=A0A9N8Z2T3_9GLOM|nr:7693_t:CDS:2 [Diversispora eburnea]
MTRLKDFDDRQEEKGHEQEEIPYEPFDEELKIDFEFLKQQQLPNAESYEFDNIKFKEPSFPEIDPREYQSREVMNEYELFGFDHLIFKDFDHDDDFEFKTAFEDFQFSIP